MRISGMGNSSSTKFKSILTSGDAHALKEVLKGLETGGSGDQTLNKKRDGALAFCLRLGHYHLVPLLLEAGCQLNSHNTDNETPLDIVLQKELPSDETILHEHFCAYGDFCGSEFTIPEVVMHLLQAGARAPSVQRLILHVMKDESAIGQLGHMIPDLDTPEQFRLAGLLLQSVVWFDQPENLQILLHRGVDIETFWTAPFVPCIEPNVVNTGTKLQTWTDSESGEYICAPKPAGIDVSRIQSLKLLFIEDWQAEWRDGENPLAQYRAGLHLTPCSAPAIIKAANSYSILCRVMQDIMSYLPPFCGGPDLRRHKLVEYLALAGYSLTQDQVRHLELTFKIDMSAYNAYAKQPKSLQQLSRVAIRFSVRSNVVHSVDKLHMLPATTRRYIAMDDAPHDLCY